MLLTGTLFVLCNAAFAFYLLAVVPHLDFHKPELVNKIAFGILALGASQVVQYVTGFGAAPTGKFNTGMLAMEAGLPVGLAWWTMEQPSFVVPAFFLLAYWGTGGGMHAGVVYLALFMTHYFRRAFVYPWFSRGRPYPLHAWASAMLFTTCNGTMQANDLLYGDASDRPLSALLGARSLLGAALFAFGMAANVQADHILANLRKPGETSGYKIPRGGLFEYVSGAHFVAEVFEWTGYGIACGSLAPAAFAAFNWMGIGTRALATHAWNVQKFGAEYPKERKRLIPLVW